MSKTLRVSVVSVLSKIHTLQCDVAPNLGHHLLGPHSCVSHMTRTRSQTWKRHLFSCTAPKSMRLGLLCKITETPKKLYPGRVLGPKFCCSALTGEMGCVGFPRTVDRYASDHTRYKAVSNLLHTPLYSPPESEHSSLMMHPGHQKHSERM